MSSSQRKCKHCSEYHDTTTGIKTPAGFFCGYEHAISFARAKTQKNWEREQRRRLADRARSQKAARNARRQLGMEVKPLSYWMKRAQSVFNAWIRASKGEQCISCGRYHDGQIHAGHYRTTAAAPELRFEPDNCWPQCAPCNTHLSGDLVRYRINLIHKIGLERVEWLEGPHEPKRYRREDYQSIEAEYKAKLSELKKSKAA